MARQGSLCPLPLRKGAPLPFNNKKGRGVGRNPRQIALACRHGPGLEVSLLVEELPAVQCHHAVADR